MQCMKQVRTACKWLMPVKKQTAGEYDDRLFKDDRLR